MSDAAVREAPPRGPAMPVLHLDGFDGPMDLLLDLAERHRIDLGRVSVAALAAQFADASEALAMRVPVERRAAWLVMATQLVLLRSLLLRPAHEPGHADGGEMRRPDALALIRAATAWLEARPFLGADAFRRPPERAPKPEGGYVALMEACLAVLRGRAGRPGSAAAVHRPMVADLWRVPDALARIRAVLAEHPEGGTLARFVPHVATDEPHLELKARAAVASTLLAGLELARAGSAEMIQGEPFGAIHVRTAG